MKTDLPIYTHVLGVPGQYESVALMLSHKMDLIVVPIGRFSQIQSHLVMVYWQLFNLLMELSIDNQNCSLPWCGKVAGFGKAGHRLKNL